MNEPHPRSETIVRPPLLRPAVALVSVLAVLALLGAQAPRASAARNLVTGFADANYVLAEADEQRTALFDETVAANAGIVRLWADWRRIAAQRPASPADPADPAYDFSQLDAAVSNANARGLDVLMMILRAPDWAEGPNRAAGAPAGTWKPSPSDLGKFARVLATRYSGSFSDGGTVLPRVGKYQIWNEANLSEYLTPQYKGRKAQGAARYARMLNASYEALKSVSPANFVVTAGTAPYGDPPGGPRTRPLIFLRDLLCLGDREKLNRTRCKTKPKFDALAHHPIILGGGPLDSAIDPDDATMADLDQVRRTLRAAERHHTIATKGRHPLWATEFWWRTHPPSPSSSITISLGRQARWYAQGLYEVWRQGASVAMILQVRDAEMPNDYSTGIEFEDGTRKPSFQAFRFPLVADRKSKRKVLAWTRPPASGALTIERQAGSGWRPVATVQATQGRISTKKLKLRGATRLRAVVASEQSLPWKVK